MTSKPASAASLATVSPVIGTIDTQRTRKGALDCTAMGRAFAALTDPRVSAVLTRVADAIRAEHTACDESGVSEASIANKAIADLAGDCAPALVPVREAVENDATSREACAVALLKEAVAVNRAGYRRAARNALRGLSGR